ncbi:Dynein heavy chain 8, axonemal [Lamellibrachia satsuma]|nr:Dynein heavy chain 8, axonemal [Lamellibrachia satsuma]
MEDVPVLEEQGRLIPGQMRGTQMMKVFATDGKQKQLTGTCLYFIRIKPEVALTPSCVVDFGVFDANHPVGGATTGLGLVLEKVFLSSFKKYQDWGELSNKTGQITLQKFFDNCRAFNDCLQSATIASGDVLKLVECEDVNLSELQTLSDCQNAAFNPETLASLETLAKYWCAQIEQVLVQSEQMRKEADDTGPLAELEHWRQRTAVFNGILEQIKSNRVRMVFHVLNIVKSKVLLTASPPFDIAIYVGRILPTISLFGIWYSASCYITVGTLRCTCDPR